MRWNSLGVGLVVDEAVLEERKRSAVGRRELAEEVVAPASSARRARATR
jgi:hypothetical protein